MEMNYYLIDIKFSVIIYDIVRRTDRITNLVKWKWPEYKTGKLFPARERLSIAYSIDVNCKREKCLNEAHIYTGYIHQQNVLLLCFEKKVIERGNINSQVMNAPLKVIVY